MHNNRIDSFTQPSRRQLLGLISAAAVFPLAGCTGDDDDTDTPTPTPVSPPDAPTIPSISCGDTLSGELTEASQTWQTDFGTTYFDSYTYDATGGEFLTLSMLGEDEYALPYLYLYGPDGELVAEDFRGIKDEAIIQYGPVTDGQYLVVATSFTPGETFAYELSLVCDDEAPDIPDAVQIDCGQTLTGELEPTDASGYFSPDHYHDRYVFDGEEGQRVTISMVAVDAEPYVALIDPRGHLIEIGDSDEVEDGLESLIDDFELWRSGEHTILATSWEPDSFFEYTLTLECE